MQLIEEKVKKIVDTNEYLSIQEKADIICLIECYKSSDEMAQEFYQENEKLKNRIQQTVICLKQNNLFELADFINNENQ